MPIQKFTVSRDDSVYEAWPDLVLTRGGSWICTFTECTHHKDRDRSRIVITESPERAHLSAKLPLPNTPTAAFTSYAVSRLPDVACYM